MIIFENVNKVFQLSVINLMDDTSKQVFFQKQKKKVSRINLCHNKRGNWIGSNVNAQHRKEGCDAMPEGFLEDFFFTFYFGEAPVSFAFDKNSSFCAWHFHLCFH